MQTNNPRGILWQLYTNAVFRKEFLFDRELFYNKYNVSPDIVDFLDAISLNEILFCAEDLLKKRMLKVKHLLPLTFKLIGKDITGVFYKFCDQYFFKGKDRHREDAIQFIHYLLKHKTFSSAQGSNLYIRSVLLYECRSLTEPDMSIEIPLYRDYDVIAGTSPVSRKRSRMPALQKFRVIGYRENWLIDRKRKDHKRKRLPIPFL